MAVAEHAGMRAFAGGERKARHRGAVIVELEQLALATGEVLGGVLHAAIAGADVELALAVEDEAGAVVEPGVHLRCLAEDHLHIRQRLAFEAAPGHRGPGATAAGLREAQIHQTVLGELRMQHDIEQAALAAGLHARHAGDRTRQGAVDVDEAEAPGTLRHQHPAIGQEGEPPGMFEAFRDRGHPHGTLLAGEFAGFRSERRGGGPGQREDEEGGEGASGHGRRHQ